MRVAGAIRDYCFTGDILRRCYPLERLSQNKHFLSVHVRMWTLSRRRRAARRRAGGRVKADSALGGRQVMLRRCRTPRSIVFPPIILSKLIYDRLFGRWTVGEAWCACTARAHVCAGAPCVLPRPSGVTCRWRSGHALSHNALVN